MGRPATDTFRDIAGGMMVEEASETLRALVLAVDEQGKGGDLTIKIKVAPAGRQSGAMNVSYEVKSNKPEGQRPSSIMWGTPEGDLLANDPRQQTLQLRTVPEVAAVELKQVNG